MITALFVIAIIILFFFIAGVVIAGIADESDPLVFGIAGAALFGIVEAILCIVHFALSL